MTNPLLNECIQYFKQNKGYARALGKIRDKFRSLGKLGGKIVLNNLNELERETLGGFLRKDLRKQKSITIKIEDFQEALEKTKFEGVDLQEVLEGYFDEELISKKEEKNIYIEAREDFFHKIIEKYTATKGSQWLNSILETQSNAYKMLMGRYDTCKQTLEYELMDIMQALQQLPCYKGEWERLAVFSTKITKDPHSFDEIKEKGKLLLYSISYLLGQEYPKNAEERNKLLYEAGILKDEISNYTVCNGLLAYTNGEIHRGWKGFYERGEPMQISLWNLSKLERIISPLKNVFVVENPTVFSSILEKNYLSKIPMVCTNGQVNIASLVLLDYLAKEGTLIYYSGDFDPEGLLIADKLKTRYANKLKLWRYTKEDYKKAMSINKISGSRLNQLKQLKCEELKNLGEIMADCEYSGYQESLIENLCEDVLVESRK